MWRPWARRRRSRGCSCWTDIPLAYRAFYALPVENFSTTTGQPTNAVYGFTSMLINVLRDEAPTHVAVAFDVSRQTFRSETFAAYKANRTASPSEFSGQVSLVKEVLAALQIETVEKEGYEADDVIATLTNRAEADGFDVLICTGDRDAYQLVSDHVTVLYPRKGVSDLVRTTPEVLQEKYGLTPAQYPDYAALRGDPSDNLPNIPGVGEKTAARWVAQYGSLEELVEHADEVKGKAGDLLRAHLGQVLTNRQLTELVRDVPLDLRSDDLALRPWDREEVHRLFDTLQFRVLRDRLYQPPGGGGSRGRPGIRCRHRAPRAGGTGPLARHPHRAGSGRRVGPRLLGSGHGRGYGDRLGHGRRGGRLVRPLGAGPG